MRLIGSGDVRFTADGMFHVRKEPVARKGRALRDDACVWRVWRWDRTTRAWQPASDTDLTLDRAKSRIQRMRKHELG